MILSSPNDLIIYRVVAALFNFLYTYLTEPRLIGYYLHPGDHNYLPEEAQGAAHWHEGIFVVSTNTPAHCTSITVKPVPPGREGASVTPSRGSQPQGSRNRCLMEGLVLQKVQGDCADLWLDEEEELIEGFKSSLVCIDA